MASPNPAKIEEINSVSANRKITELKKKILLAGEKLRSFKFWEYIWNFSLLNIRRRPEESLSRRMGGTEEELQWQNNRSEERSQGFEE